MECETERVRTKPETSSEAPCGLLLAARYMDRNICDLWFCGIFFCPCYSLYSNRKIKPN